MANEHIGRRRATGLGPESTSGTYGAVSVWIPTESGGPKTEYETAKDESGRGRIESMYNTETIKKLTTLGVDGMLSNVTFPHILKATFGQDTVCRLMTITGTSGGTPAKGDSISSATGSWTGSIKKVLIINATTYYAVKILTGTYSNQTDVTNGTWTSGDTVVTSGAYVHLFEVLNTNTHPSYTLYSSDPVGDERSAYGMLDTLDLEIAVGDFAKFSSQWMAKAAESTSGLSPAYTDEVQFLSKHADLYFAATESDLNAATAIGCQRFKLSIAKNLEAIQEFGDTDVASIHNKNFTAMGDLDALYKDTVLRDYLSTSEKKACRLALINDEATALATGIYPSLYIDIAKAAFSSWSRTDDLDGLTSQTLGFDGCWSDDDSMSLHAVIIDAQSTAY